MADVRHISAYGLLKSMVVLKPIKSRYFLRGG
jgi:hypothetical protein